MYEFITGRFPEQMDIKTEEELMSDMHRKHKKAPASREQLILCNLRMVLYMVRKYSCEEIEPAELFSVGSIGLIHAIDTFDTARKARLSAYAFRCIENEIRMYLRKWKSWQREIPEEMIPETKPADSCWKRLEGKETVREISRALLLLPEKEQQVVCLRFGFGADGYADPENDGMTQKSAAVRLGFSQSYISRLERKGLVRLKNFLTS